MKGRFRISYWLVVFFSLGLLMVPASWVGAQVPPVLPGQKIFVHILNPPILGESTDKDHKDWIDASSYSDGVLNGGSVVFSGTMRSDFRAVQITKFLDKASPKLFQAAAAGTHIRTVIIDIVRTRADSTTFLVAEVVLTEVLVTEVLMTVNLVDLPQETVTFDFARIQLTYHAPDGTQATFSWDRLRNTP